MPAAWLTNHYIGSAGLKMANHIPLDTGQASNFFPYMGSSSIADLLTVTISLSGMPAPIYGRTQAATPVSGDSIFKISDFRYRDGLPEYHLGNFLFDDFF